MWLQFYLENIHFAINLFTALVFFAVSFLYFDAWIGRRSGKELLRAIGFLLLSLSFIILASSLETILLPQTILKGNLLDFLYILTHLLGYLLIIISLFHDHLQARPKTAALSPGNFAFFGLTTPFNFSFILLSPFLSLACALLYLRRAYFGLEHHLRLISLSFLILTLFEILSLSALLRSSDNVDLYNLVAPFGPIWILEHLTLLVAALLLGKWIFGYLLKQLQTQLMMIFSVGILVIFLLTTVTFTSLLIQNLQTQTITELETNTKVLELSLKSKQEQNISDAQVLAQNPDIQKAIASKNTKFLVTAAQNFLTAKKLSTVIIIDSDAQVLARGEDPERFGDSVSSDSLVKKALLNQSTSSVVLHQGVISPQLVTISTLPINPDSKKVIGVILIGNEIDNSFIDNIKKVTGLEFSVYGQDTMAATTLVLPDNKTRAVGTKLSDQKIINQVLKTGQPFSGEASILNKSYFASFLPIKDSDNETVGMLFVGELQTATLMTAGRSIELTFILAAILLMVSIIPAAVISKKIAYQLH